MHARFGIAERRITEERRDIGLERPTPERGYPAVRRAVVSEVLVAECSSGVLRCGKKSHRGMDTLPLETHAIAKEIRVLVHGVDTSRDPVAESLTHIECHTPVVERAALQ